MSAIPRRNRPLRLSPVQFVAVTFVLAILAGAGLLALPISHDQVRVGLLDALFTATSAVCVTGLAVVDTGTAYSLFGQLVILALIQLGGLGVLTFGTLLAIASGRRIGLGERLRVQQQVNALDVGGIVALVRTIALIVVATEALGALLLSIRFIGDQGVVRGLYHAVFHSVSAFNNAGFGLYPDSLERYVTDPLVNVTIMALIVVGGLGFVVIVNLGRRLRSTRPRVTLTLHTRMAVMMTAFLIAFGTASLLIFEWNNPGTFGELSPLAKVQAALFASITPRTAGFNTVPYGEMVPASLMLTMLLMFIGGSPGSTAGGIKTVTFYVQMVTVWAVLRGRTDTTVFGRRLTTATVQRAGSISFVAVMVGGAALTLLALVVPDQPFLSLMFEAVSALGTTGLSTGVTADVGTAGRWILIVLMYLGRIGFLTFALALVVRQRNAGVRFLSEEVVIG